MADDYDYGGMFEQEDRIGYAKILQDNKIVEIPYCLKCGSINIQESKKGNLYCADLCWVKDK